MSRSARSALLPFALLAFALLPAPSGAQAVSGVEWWGPTEIGQGHHIRVLVDVSNPLDVPIVDGLAAADLDLAKLLIAAKWTSVPAGDSDVLAGFHLDMNSVRVVAMTDLEPHAEGTTHGSLLAVDRSLPASDLRRYEVPAMAIEGALDGDGASFDASVDPHITVLWRVPGTLAPNAHRSFVVYLDSDRTSPPHEPADLSGPSAAALQSLFWSGAGTTLYGLVAPPSGAGSVQVIGLHPDTHVQVAAGPVGQALLPAGTAATLQANQVLDRGVTTGPPVVVRVTADKPVLALGTSAGFVPSLDGTMAGTSFIVSLRHPSSWRQDTLYAMAAGGHTKPTTVEVTRLDGSSSFTTTLNGGLNTGPYTVGARSQFNSNCQPADAQRPTPLLPATTGLYRVKVTQGGPILLQMQPVDGLFQVPSVDGTPAGTRFQVATGWTEGMLAAGRCIDISRQGSYAAFSLDGPGHANVTSAEKGVQVDPPGSPGSQVSAYPPPRNVPSAPRFAGPFDVNVRDRPVLVSTDVPSQILAGLVPAQVGADSANRPTYGSRSDPGVHGPLGGAEAGRRFSSLGPFSVVAPFAGTHVDMDILRESGTSSQSLDLAADASAAFTHDGPDLLRSARIESDRPVVVLPPMTSGYFAAIPARLTATALSAEFRGYLIDVSSPTGLDPVAASTTPGKPVTYTIEVRNRGRGVSGPIADDAILEVDASALPPGWPLPKLDKTTLQLGPGATQQILLTVTPPTDAGQSAIGPVRVVATSANNDAVTDALLTVTTLRRSYDVGLWFDRPLEGPKALPPLSIDQGETAVYRLAAMNEGSVPDILLFEVNELTGWTQALIRCHDQPLPPLAPPKPCDGDPISQLALEAGEVAWLDLRVTPPDGAQSGFAPSRITVRSQAAPLAATDRVSALTRLAQPSELDLDAVDTSVLVRPGEDAEFLLKLSSRGGATQVDLSAQGGNDTAWGAPQVVARTGSATTTERINVLPDAPVDVVVTIRAGDDLPAGATTALRVVAKPTEGVEREAFVLATVAAVHGVTATLPDLPLLGDPGENVSAEVRLTNGGNVDENLTLAAIDLPLGWALNATPDVLLPRGATQAVRLAIAVPPATLPGIYNVTLAFDARDGNRTLAELTVGLGQVLGAGLGAGDTLPVQPGELASQRAPVRNEGNVPLRVLTRAAPGESWTLAAGPERILQPGETAGIALTWKVPRDASGTSVHRAVLDLRAADGSASSEQPVTASFDVRRPQLRLDAAEPFAGAAGTVVRATITNAGERPARDFVVQLTDGDTAIGNATVGLLAPGETVTVTLLLASDAAARVVVDPDDRVVEGSESDNEAPVTAIAHDAPAPVGLAIALLLLALAWRRR